MVGDPVREDGARALAPPPVPANADVVLEVRDASVSGALQLTNLTVRVGEIVGVSGLDGAGHVELAEVVAGSIRSRGTMRIGEVEVGRRNSTERALQAGVGFVPEDRHISGAAILGVLCASASYVAAPAAVRMSLPEANLAYPLAASLGVTFPVNLTIGIPSDRADADHARRVRHHLGLPRQQRMREGRFSAQPPRPRSRGGDIGRGPGDGRMRSWAGDRKHQRGRWSARRTWSG